jgi:hypothetical protein
MMSKLIAQHRMAVALVGAVALLAVLLALSSFVVGSASGTNVGNRLDLASQTPLFRNA